MKSRTINSENTSLLDEKAIAVTKFQLVNIVEEGYSLDEVMGGNIIEAEGYGEVINNIGE